jgi:membrane protein implicated in regulation of membrane protease activity
MSDVGFTYFPTTREVIVAPWIWFLTAGLMLVAEMLTVDLVFASLAFAALAAGITDAAGGSRTLQGVAFGLSALLFLTALRPITLRHLRKQQLDSATNVDALIGARAVVTTSVHKDGGQVKLNGEIWSAYTDFEILEEGESVIVIAIDGATARVKKLEEK